MPPYPLTSSIPWYRRRAQRWLYLSMLPTRRLISLYLAVFCIFATFGSYQNLIHAHRFSIVAVVMISVVNGAYSILYPYLLIRLHYHHSNGRTSQLMIPQLPIGLLPAPPYIADQVQTAPGDLLVIATDGILEACNQQEEEFGSSRLESLIAAHAREPLAALAARITNAVHVFGPQVDDQTLLMVRHNPVQPGL